MINDGEDSVNAEIVVYDYCTDDNREGTTWEGNIPGSGTNGCAKTINLSGWLCDILKLSMYVQVYDNNDKNEIIGVFEIVKINVNHSMWKEANYIHCHYS
ncbi:MAG: hypothetical protein MJZ03_02450 [archaeon]|nr:hypothetical protein [archaeon]